MPLSESECRMDKTRLPDIPYELIIDIVTRLPVKSLKRFSCVNKSWYTLIQSASFISRHYSYHSSCNVKLMMIRRELSDIFTRNSFISILSDDGDTSQLSIPIAVNEKRVDIIGPCINGIFCLIKGKSNCFDNFALWNPATNEYKRIPQCPIAYPLWTNLWIQGVGFGWVQETNEYKLVIPITLWDHKKLSTDVFVYTLSTNCWKKHSPVTPFQPSSINNGTPSDSQIFINGVCYWINQCISVYFNLYSFHMRDEVFGKIQMPDFETESAISDVWFSLSTIDGRIALIMHEKKGVHILVDIWVMRKSWIKEFKIRPPSGFQMSLGIMNDDELLLEDKKGQLLSIELNSQKVKKLQIRGAKYTIKVLEYVESLASIKR